MLGIAEYRFRPLSRSHVRPRCRGCRARRRCRRRPVRRTAGATWAAPRRRAAPGGSSPRAGPADPDVDLGMPDEDPHQHPDDHEVVEAVVVHRRLDQGRMLDQPPVRRERRCPGASARSTACRAAALAVARAATSVPAAECSRVKSQDHEQQNGHLDERGRTRGRSVGERRRPGSREEAGNPAVRRPAGDHGDTLVPRTRAQNPVEAGHRLPARGVGPRRSYSAG